MSSHKGRGRNKGQRRTQDAFGKRAKLEGYPARSVFKLEEIDRRIRLFKKGQKVLDLGAAPGSWLLYAAEKVGEQGKVVGIDLKPIQIALPKQATFFEQDIFTFDPSSCENVPCSFDVVMSDMAPATSGQRHADQFRSFELYVQALELAERFLIEGGTFVGKIFQGAEFQEARDKTRMLFEKVRIIQPKATRKESYEVFLIGLNSRP